jgi:hypothetical protein
VVGALVQAQAIKLTLTKTLHHFLDCPETRYFLQTIYTRLKVKYAYRFFLKAWQVSACSKTLGQFSPCYTGLGFNHLMVARRLKSEVGSRYSIKRS